MKCLFCDKEGARLSKSRPTARSRRRTYVCLKGCKRRFTTLEVPEVELPHRLVDSLRYNAQSPPQTSRK